MSGGQGVLPAVAAEHGQRFAAGVAAALALVDAVHGGGDAADVARLLDGADVPALCVALAALVPEDRPLGGLLGWWTAARAQLAETSRLVAAGVDPVTARTLGELARSRRSGAA